MGKFALFALVLVLVLFSVSLIATAKIGGTPSGYTGAPAVNGRNCTSCHSGTVNSGPGSVVVQAPSVYAPGSVVPVTVSLTNMQNAARNGYQAAAYNTGNKILSGWTSPNQDSSVSSNHVNQTSAGYRKNTWLTYFQTPSSPVTFSIYSCGLDANGDSGRSNDRTYTTSHKMTPGTVNLSMTALPKVGTVIPMALNAPGDANKAYVMASSFGNTGIKIGGGTVPLSVDTLLLLSVQNLLPTIFRNYRGVLNGSGTAGAGLAAPNVPALAGVTIYSAFVVLDPTKPGGIGTISNGLMMQLF